MKRRDLRLVPLAAVVWSTALVCVFAPWAGWWWVAAAGGTGVILVAVLVRSAGSERLSARARGGLAAVLLLASCATAMTVGFAAPDRAKATEFSGRVVEVVAEISSSSSVGSDGRVWFDAQTRTIGASGVAEQLSVPVRIGVEPFAEGTVPEGGLDLGTTIRVSGQVAVTDLGERAALVVFGTDAEIVTPARGVFAVAAQVRHDFVQRAVGLPEPGAGLLPGLAVGDTRAVPEELNSAMLTSGLSHLTAVSGANCAIVVGAVFWFAALCGAGRMLRVVLAVVALAAFVILVTPEPSVIRAAVMAGLAMLTILRGRPSAGLGVLSLAVTGILIADPWLAATPGFALSAAATAALIVLAPPLARGMTRWMPAPIALAIAIPLAAQLACGPIIALFAEQQSLVSIAANLLAAPAAPIATVVGLLACLAAPIPPLADLLAASAWLPAAWISTTATTTAALPGAQILVVPGIGAALLVALLSAAVGVVLFRTRTGGMPPVLFTRAASGVLVIAVALTCAHTLMTGPLATATVTDEWSIAACDVGQGDALLVRSGGEVALIDTGPDPLVLDVCLRSLGIDHIELLVLTHFDLDHVGGTSTVVGRVETVLHGPAGEPEDERLLAELARSGADVVTASAGQQGMLGDASWRVHWPRRDSAAFPSGNDASVVISFAGGGVPTAIFLGDLSAVPQRMLMSSGQLGAGYAVVKVAHHGSADQDAELYGRLRPVAAIFSAGVDNDYGHPREETLALLEAAGAVVLRTDQQGRILLSIRDGTLAVWTETSTDDGG